MPRQPRGPREPHIEIEQLRARLEEAEETLRAIRAGEVDALVVSTTEGERIYTLKGAEQPYRQLIEDMNEGAVTLSLDGVILYCNRRFAEMLKAPLQRVIGSTLEDWIAPEERMTFQTLLRRSGRENQRSEIALRASDDSQLPALLSLNLLSVDGMRTICLVATNLTEQKRSAAIVAAESLARTVLEQAAEAIVVCDEHGWIIRASEAAQRYSAQSPVGHSFAEAFPLHLAQGGRFPLGRVLRGERVQGMEARLEREGQSFDLLVSAGPLVDAQNEPLGCAITLIDIGERRRTEEALRRSEAMYRRLAEANIVGVGYGDTKGNITYVNDEMLRMMGYTRADYEAGRVNWAESLAPEYRADFERWGEILLREGRIIGYERAFMRPDGGLTPYLGAAALVTPGEDFHVRIALDLTKIRATEAALRESETRYRSLFEGSAIPILEEDFSAVAERFAELRTAGARDFQAYLTQHPEEVRQLRTMIKIVDANPASLKMFGVRSKDELIAHLPALIHEDSWDVFREEMIALAAGQTVFHAETPVLGMGGETRIISLHLAVAPGAEQSLSRVLVSLLDITARQRTEEALRLANEQFSTTLRALPLVVFMQDSDLRYTWIVNPAPGYDVETIIGKTDAELIEDQVEAQRAITLKRAVLSDGMPRQMELHFRGPGFDYWYELHVQAQRDAAGAVVGVLGTAMDISERKQAETLQQAKERFGASLQASPVVVYTLDRDLRYTWVFNPRLFQNVEDVIGKTDAELYEHPEDGQRIMDIKRAVLEDGNPRRETVRIRHQGSEHVFDMYIRPQRSATGDMIGLLGTSTEVERRPV